jgi:hypothetical protein
MNVASPILSDLGTAALEYAARGWHVPERVNNFETVAFGL